MVWRSPLTSMQVLEFLPLNTWTEVVLFSLTPSNDVYIATTEDNIKKQIEDMNKMSKLSYLFEKVKEFKALEIVAVHIYDQWYRGRMICYNEFLFNDTRIELIDVGLFYHTQLENVFVLPYFLLYEPLALSIKFQGFIPKTTQLTIKPDLSKSSLFEGVVLVDIYSNINFEKNRLDTKNYVINSPLSSNLSTYNGTDTSSKCTTYNPARKNIALKSGDYCFIQCFQDLSNIYVCNATQNIVKENGSLCDVGDVLLRTFYSKDQKIKKNPTVGDTVKIFSSLKKGYLRATILKKNNHISYDVFYIDYGNIETILSSEIYELAQELREPSLVIKVGVRDLVLTKNNTMKIDDKILELFKTFIENKKPLEIEFDETSKNCLQDVKFKELENGYYLNNILMKCLKEPTARVFKRDFIVGDTVKVITQNCIYRAKIYNTKKTIIGMVPVYNIDTGAHNFVNSIYELSKDLLKVPGLATGLSVEGLKMNKSIDSII